MKTVDPNLSFSLSNLCVLCVSVVGFHAVNYKDTEDTEVAQRKQSYETTR
jgi:hypothetical protein